ncbi:MAG: zf-TFIIB domain-containing protein [Vicinamibacteria bacterium]
MRVIIRTIVAAVVAAGCSRTSWEKKSQEFVVAGDWGFERYSCKSTDTSRGGGAAVRDTGWGFVIYHHDADGKWRVARDAFGTDQPLPTKEGDVMPMGPSGGGPGWGLKGAIIVACASCERPTVFVREPPDRALCAGCAGTPASERETVRLCPVDGSPLTVESRSNVDIDRCPECGGVWLNSGELDVILRAASAPTVSACPKCAGEMEAGSVWAQGGGRGVWCLGDTFPEQNFHVFPPGVEWSGPRHRIVTQRCKRCGFLESYAPEAT